MKVKTLLWPAKLLAPAYLLWLVGFGVFLVGTFSGNETISDPVTKLGILVAWMGLVYLFIQAIRILVVLGGLGKWYVYPSYTRKQPRKPIFILGIGFSEEAVAGPFFTAAGARKWIESNPL